ncbi:MAG: flagellar basal body-associated FliL family protein [Methylohalobius sp.]|nr:flagellar basal body-associated FliL family protein [Methylohalobius sp.]
MAKKTEDLDLGVDQKPAKTKWVILLLVSALVLMVGTAAGLYFTGIIHFGKPAPAEQAPSSVKRPHFYELEPFIVNFPHGGAIRLLQVGFSLLSFDEKTIGALTKHTPVLRNNLLLLLSRQQPENLQSAEGKEMLRQAVTQEIQNLLEKQAGGGNVETIFFTQFVMQ